MMEMKKVNNREGLEREGPLGSPRKRRLEDSWGVLRRNRMAFAGLVIFVLFFATAITGLILTSGTEPYFDPSAVRLQEKLRPPMAKPNIETLYPEEIPRLGVYLFGTDDLGRDVFSRMLQGAWVSLTVGFVAVGIAVFIGIFLGGIAGYFGQNSISIEHVLKSLLLFTGMALLFTGHRSAGIVFLIMGIGWIIYPLVHKQASGRGDMPLWLSVLQRKAVLIDTLIMRVADIMLCFPSFFLILTVVALLPASIYNIMIVIGLTSWMGTTRFVRAEFLSLREQDFVTAARALGLSNLRIIFRHMMPNAIAPVLVSATIGIATAILTEAGLSFLGFGVPPPHATWGNILSDGKRFIFDAPWLTFVPGFAILIVVLSFNLFGEGLRDIVNPKLRERH
jgi:peptide/nickel transport system permease protein